jgi:hypothetical protein
MIACQERDGTNCRIASAAIGETVTECTDAACVACQTGQFPRMVNHVTLSLALSACRKLHCRRELIDALLIQHAPHNPHHDHVSQEAARRITAILDGTGVGSQVWRLLESIGIKHNVGCDCLAWAERMNAWGPVGCRHARPLIVEHMRASAKSYGWGDVAKAVTKAVTTGLAFRLNPLDPFGGLLDEGIRLAEQVKAGRLGTEALQSSTATAATATTVDFPSKKN